MADKVNLTPEQQEAISEIDRNLQMIACAGSGKTEVITQRIANILKSRTDIEPHHIVAFTFTEKAASSMKERIAKALGEEFSPEIDQIILVTGADKIEYCQKEIIEKYGKNAAEPVYNYVKEMADAVK